MEQDLARVIASNLLEIKAVLLSPKKPFTWASGIKSPIYTDNRVTLAYPKVRGTIADGFAQIINQEFPEVEVIAGTATAGIPHGALVADRLNLPFAYIRSKPKDHGTGRQIEGRVTAGEKMVVIDDLISTGGSVLEAVRVATTEGANVIGVAAIFTYQLPQSVQNFAQAQVKLVNLTDYSTLIELAQETGYVDQEELDLLKKFKADQVHWQD